VLARRDVWRGREPHATAPTVATGWCVLDEALPGGGWPLGALTEVCCEHDGLGELSLVMPALARLAGEDRWIGFVAPPHPLYAPALAQAGLALDRCLIVGGKQGSTPGPRAQGPVAGAARVSASLGPGPYALGPGSLWAAEQLLRGGACAAVLLWSADEDPQALRRLQLAAEAGGALALLYRPAQAARRVSPAALRLRMGAGRAVEIFKCRGTTLHAGHGLRFEIDVDVLLRSTSLSYASPRVVNAPNVHAKSLCHSNC
jgi:cell division inhibitor SulA/protein ImuA